jgi:hypothetical protein
MANIEFSYICGKKFDELAGDDQVNRFCGDCAREVINFDALDEREQREFLTSAQRAGVKTCVSATVQLDIKGVPCVKRPSPLFRVELGEMLTPYDSTEPFREAEADSRIKEISARARKRLQETSEEDPH